MNFFKDDIQDSLDVLMQEKLANFLYCYLWLEVKWEKARTVGYYVEETPYTIHHFFNGKCVGFVIKEDSNTFVANNVPEFGYYKALAADLHTNLMYNADFCLDYIKHNAGKNVFVRSNSYKELVDEFTYNYRVKFFNAQGERVKELHAFPTKDYCLPAFKQWHHESFEIVDLSEYKYIYAVRFAEMNALVCSGYLSVYIPYMDITPYKESIHFDTYVIEHKDFFEEDEPFVDLYNEWQVIASNEPIVCYKVDKN